MAMQHMQQESNKNFNRCLDLDVHHYGASVHLANLYVKLGRAQQAARYFANAIRVRPEAAAPHFGLMLAVKR